MRGTAWHRAAPEDRAPAGVLRWSVRVVALVLVAALLPWAGSTTAADGAVAGLLSAPFLAILAAGLYYGRRRDWTHVGLVAVLLVVLLAGAWLGFR